jgi:predicted dehydrogenase
VAVASRSQDKANAYALEKKIKLAYGSYEALLADPEIDVIYNPESPACRMDHQGVGGRQARFMRETHGVKFG